jgi:hypothetical protein
MRANLAFCYGCDSVLVVAETHLEIDVQIALNQIPKAYAFALGLALTAAMGISGTAFAQNPKVVVLDFDDPNRSGVRQIVLDMLSDKSDIDLMLTGDVEVTAKQAEWNLNSRSDRHKLSKELGIDAWIKGSVTEKWRVVIQILSGDGEIKGEAEFFGKRKSDLLREVSQKFWFALGYLISESANEERIAWLKEQARQKGLAAHRELAHKKAEWRQKELFRQKELALERERKRLERLEEQRRLAVQKATARNDEIGRQKEIVRERERAAKREMERQQELARKEQLAKQREYSEQQHRLQQQQQLANQQMQTRQQALAQQRASLTGQPPPVVRQPAATPGQYFGTKASTTYGQTPKQTPTTTTRQTGVRSTQSPASLYYGLQTSESTDQYSAQQPSAVTDQTSTPKPSSPADLYYGQQPSTTSSTPAYEQEQATTPSTPTNGAQASSATASGAAPQPSSPADLYYGQPTASTTSPYAAQQPATTTTTTRPRVAQKPAVTTVSRKPKKTRLRPTSYYKKAQKRKQEKEDDGCTILSTKPGSSDGWIAGGFVLILVFVRRQKRRAVWQSMR